MNQEPDGGAQVGDTTSDDKLPLPVEPGELTQTDPSLENARQAANRPLQPGYTGPRFEWKGSLLYQREGDNRLLVVPAGLCARLLFLAHTIPLAGHQAAEKTLARLVQGFYWLGIRAQVT